MTTTCASCRYHAERGCYVAPVSVHRKPDDPACVQFAARGPQDAPGATQRASSADYGRETAHDHTAQEPT